MSTEPDPCDATIAKQRADLAHVHNLIAAWELSTSEVWDGSDEGGEGFGCPRCDTDMPDVEHDYMRIGWCERCADDAASALGVWVQSPRPVVVSTPEPASFERLMQIVAHCVIARAGGALEVHTADDQLSAMRALFKDISKLAALSLNEFRDYKDALDIANDTRPAMTFPTVDGFFELVDARKQIDALTEGLRSVLEHGAGHANDCSAKRGMDSDCSCHYYAVRNLVTKETT